MSHLRRPLALIALGLGACGQYRMQVPPEIAARSEVLEAKDRSRGLFASENFKLGPYAVTDVDRDWGGSSEFSVGPLTKDTAKNGYGFAFRGPGAGFAGQCASAAGDTKLKLGSFHLSSHSAKIGCSCKQAGHIATVFVEGDGSTFKGQLGTSRGSYEIRSTLKYEGGGESADAPTGFRVDGATPTGAVDVVHPGRVYLDKGLDSDEKAELSCLFVGLMLYEPPPEVDAG